MKQLWDQNLQKIWTGFEPLTSAIPVQFSTTWAIKPNENRSRCSQYSQAAGKNKAWKNIRLGNLKTLPLFVTLAWPNEFVSGHKSHEVGRKTHFKTASCISLAENGVDVTQLALTWVRWLNGENLRPLECRFDLDQSERKSSQVHARPGQTE